MISTASDTAQIAATTKTCSRRMPWRSTKRFCAPIATMSEKPRPRPASTGSEHVFTLRAMLRTSPAKDSSGALA